MGRGGKAAVILNYDETCQGLSVSSYGRFMSCGECRITHAVWRVNRYRGRSGLRVEGVGGGIRSSIGRSEAITRTNNSIRLLFIQVLNTNKVMTTDRM
jgi:hypothetical protein